MAKGVFLFAIGAVGAALLAPPSLDRLATAPSGPAPGAAPAASAEEGALKPAEQPTSGYRETEIEADPRGQYVTDAYIDGMSVRMMIDTGATFVALSASTAARIGLVPGPGPKWTIKTANGQSIASPVILHAMSFGGLYMNDVQALILAPEAGDVNLIGASFLKRLVSVEQRDGVLILRQ
ncbi:MAG TPA: TIGR02281 family clan AA aspartic protease [Roseiarcus sp.]|nr:TIGR02281 family clan AA aspartic protease [Roseiarcus sp.]